MATTPLGCALGAFLGLLAGLGGCVSISGPCELRVDGTAKVLACQPGGSVFLLPPSVLGQLTRREERTPNPRE